MIKLIASDMDGTLLNSAHTICRENINAIKKAKEMGVEFTIVTGRDYRSVEPIAKEFGLNCEYILMNGAEYRNNNGEVIYSISIDLEIVAKVIEVLTQSGLCAEIFTDDYTYITNKEKFEDGIFDRIKFFSPKMSDEEILKFIETRGDILKAKYIEDINDIIEDRAKVYKIIAFDMNEKIISKAKKILSEISGLAVASTFSNDIEITHIDAQKGITLERVIQERGIEKDEVIVLGDSFNDYSMFKEFNNSYAMENAIPEIKEIAGNITSSNDDAGVAKAIYSALEI